MFQQDNGHPVTARADIVGPVGGFGWILKINQGAPKSLIIQYIEVRWSNPLLLHIQYPIGTSVTILPPVLPDSNIFVNVAILTEYLNF